MTSLPPDPLTGTDRLLIDGTNLLHAMTRRAEAAPQAALIGRLRAMVPAAIGIELVFDGRPEMGMRGERVAAGLIVRHAGRRTADELLLSLVDEARGAVGPAGTAGLLVVSDDHALRAALRAKGARTAGSAWLLKRLERPRLSAPSIGNRRPPTGAGGGHPGGGSEPERKGWKPGRGATTKRGNPRRGRPSSGSMPS
ncbi:MAG: hypothetical protein ACXW4T_05735 [Candidatus Limnocylindrales bacterium]